MNTQILLILGLFLLNNENSNELHIIKDYISTMEIDPKYTQKKINIANKILPLLPSEYIIPFEQGLSYTSSIVKILELKDAFTYPQKVQFKPVKVKDNKERLNKIMAILQEESLNTDFANMGTAMNILSNLDNYKNMLNVFTKLNNDKEKTKDKDDLLGLVQSIIGGDKNNKDTQDMKKIIEIISLLNSSKKEDESIIINND